MREMEVDLAKNGREAVDMFAGSEPGYYSAILMDLQMPLMNGLEAARAIRALDEVYSKVIPIIAISANAHENDIRDSLDAGMDTHIAKPFDPDKLLKTLQHLIRKRKNEEET